MDKVWENESSRAVEVLGGEPVRYTRQVEDKLRMRFSLEEWNRIFNVATDYVPSDQNYNTFVSGKDIEIFFIRRKNEGTTK